MKQTTKRILLALFILVIIAGILVAFASIKQSGTKSTISNFEECVTAGYPIQETYPERCAVPGGQTFTKQY